MGSESLLCAVCAQPEGGLRGPAVLDWLDSVLRLPPPALRGRGCLPSEPQSMVLRHSCVFLIPGPYLLGKCENEWAEGMGECTLGMTHTRSIF